MPKPTNKSVLCVLLLITGCATQQDIGSQRTQSGLLRVSHSQETSSCLTLFAAETLRASQELDSKDIRVVNWNIQKGSDADWIDDLHAVTADPDLLILQEASPRFDAWQALVPNHHRSFAAGFGKDRNVTGVMTISSAAPVRECDLVAREPWFGTRKATLITEYELSGTDETLLVANIHGVNFTLGVRDLYWQLRQTEAVLALHDGPMLFSGDFNTWRGKRARVLDEIVATLGLAPLDYEVDHRKRVLGRALDHMFVRDLRVVGATTRDLRSSDHNPMMVRLIYEPPEAMVHVFH